LLVQPPESSAKKMVIDSTADSFMRAPSKSPSLVASRIVI
jgi:hypothetical protein